MNSLERYKDDLEKLIETGEILNHAMQYECSQEAFENAVRKKLKDRASELLDRLDDFIGHYEKPKTRKNINYESYRISDYLMGLQRTDGLGREIVSPAAAIPRFKQ